MNRHLYSILLYLLSPLLLAYLSLRAFKSPDYRGRWGERFGFSKLKPTQVLIHSVSMGETLAAIPLVKALMKAHPEWRFTITTTSPTGSAQVIKAFGDTVQHCYLPFDLPFSVRRFLRQLSPELCIIMETELWPNLLHQAHNLGCKLVLANARLSQKSANNHARFPELNRPMLQSLTAIAVQTQVEAERFIALGVDASRVQVCGSLKFDIQIDELKRQQATALRQQWRRTYVPVWVAGSVHPGEFAAVLAAHQQLLARFPRALLIMAPRHPEQFELAASSISQAGLQLVRRSAEVGISGDTQVLLGDTMGELLMLYGCADHAFVGGTLIENGGHNPLEPAAMGLSVCVGPHHWDFVQITALLADAGGLTVVTSADKLAERLLSLFEQPEMAQKASAAALSVVTNNRGALAKQLAVIEAIYLIK
ncbi:lipid IV(A) 3-deoxy-D-manno-octulosonic acid transferase [Shewanella sp. SR44-3]|uniref:lipid IV(A) 3-deoxy-D-manno-octulosonic acid transferase n=1 Tax=Shewanella sp. SR44-3 TaxID=2760936 RepID=UPI0015FDAE3F|nr:lipid IV(A) 3-deoxy-D-manno-octulosonic acid transferase [Shewanella sp. SR44-3]MBB1268423.1 lipid IV(A) 3-deoxy-D-manno-octulosonic acid transferase [Shewanella sp. SR44-3]